MRYHGWFKPQHDFEYAVQALEAGLHGFEVVGGESHYDPEQFKVYRENIKRIKEELEATLPSMPPSPISTWAASTAGSGRHLCRMSRLPWRWPGRLSFRVAVHASPGILAMPGGKWSKETASPTIRDELVPQEEFLVRSIKDLADLAPDLLICLENLVYPHELYRSPEELKRLLGKVNRSNVGFTLDVGHAVVSGYQPSEFINLLFDEIFHVHLHDNSGSVDEHLPLGQGTIDYVHVIQSLKQLDYQGVVTFEFSLEDPNSYRDYLYKFS